MSWNNARLGAVIVVLLLFLVLAFWSAVRQRRRHQCWKREPYPFHGGQLLRGASVLGAVFMVGLAYLRPMFGYEERPRVGRGEDLMVVLDISHSMLAGDLSPSRLERAKREIMDLLQVSAGARVGLVVTGETAYLQCPPTRDGEALKLFLAGVSDGEAEGRGSDLGEGIRLATEALKRAHDEDRPRQSILIFSDGEDHGNTAKAAVKAAVEAGIRVSALGFGSEEGAPLPEKSGGWKKDGEGRIVISRLDPSLLEELARLGGGAYALSSPDDRDLEALGLLAGSEESLVREEGTERVPRERYPLFIWAAFGLLFFEGWSRRGRRPNGSRRLGA